MRFNPVLPVYCRAAKSEQSGSKFSLMYLFSFKYLDDSSFHILPQLLILMVIKFLLFLNLNFHSCSLNSLLLAISSVLMRNFLSRLTLRNLLVR